MSLVSLLSEVLKDYSDVRISMMTGIERTRINRIRNGKFKIEFDELNRIISTFVFDDEMKSKLYDAYLLEKLGKDKYRSRQLAKEFLRSLRSFGQGEDGVFHQGELTSVNVNFDIPDSIVTLDNALSLRRAISLVLTEAAAENDDIYIMSSPFDSTLISLIMTISSAYRKLDIKHIFSISSNNELTEPLTYYMQVARSVYPIFMLNTNYKAYYSLVGSSTNSLLPFYVLTSKYIVDISYDLTCGVIVKKKSVVDMVKKLFVERIKTSTPFIRKISTPGEFLQHYGKVMEAAASSGAATYYSLDYEPCMLHFFTSEDLQAFNRSTKDAPVALALVEKMEKILLPAFNKKNQVAFFTKKGVEAFIETGCIAEIPDGLGLVIKYERRRELLQCVLNAMKNEEKSKYIYRLFNENEFDPPLGLRFLGSGSTTDHLFVMSNSEDGVRSILSLSNPDIVSSVFDFIESLETSDMVYSREEMIAYMEDVIAKM